MASRIFERQYQKSPASWHQRCSIGAPTVQHSYTAAFAPHIRFFLLPRRRKTGSSDIAELPAPVLNYTIAIGTLSVKTFLSLSYSSFYLYFHSMVSYSFHLPCFILLSFALFHHPFICPAFSLPCSASAAEVATAARTSATAEAAASPA